MRPHAHHGRRGGGGERGARASRTRRLALAGAGLSALALLGGGLASAQERSRPTVVRDAGGDVGAGGLDITRVSVGIAPDGRIRAAFTMAGPWSPRDLLADSGPPGSICLRAWLGGRRPSASQPDYLVCATVGANNERLKASVFHERPGQLPERVASASATKPSARTAVLRFGQSVLGRPAVLRFAAETAPGGCTRLSCVDTAPDAPRSARLALR